MPMFEFQCRQCGHRFETLVLSATRSATSCPSCDGKDLEKLYSVFGTSSGHATGRSSAPVSFGGG
jgi:putative FmdB family regulatory protein